MQDSIIIQKKKSSLFSSLLLFLGVIILILPLFFLGNKYYSQNSTSDNGSEFPRVEAPEEDFDPLPPNELPLSNSTPEEPLSYLDLSEARARIRIQNEWNKKVLPRLISNKMVEEEIKKILTYFHDKFLEKGLGEKEKKWWKNTKLQYIRPQKVAGRTVTKETRTNDIEECKKIFPELEQAGVFWDGFAGWLIGNEKGEEEEEKEGGEKGVIMGLCISEGEKKSSRWRYKQDFWGRKSDFKLDLCYWTNRHITIKLKPELFFTYYNNSWVTLDEKTGNPLQLRVGWKELRGTIAHELAHAAINTIIINGDKMAKLKEGHGGLHNNFTERIERMISSSSEWEKFELFIKKFFSSIHWI